MKNICILFVLLLGFLYTKGQYQPPNNILLNPTFDNFNHYVVNDPWDINCGVLRCGYRDDITGYYHVYCLNNWKSPSLGTSAWVAIDTCNHWIKPYPSPPFGRALTYITIFTEFPDSIYTNRQYIQGNLQDTLIAGRKYCVSFYVALDVFSRSGTPYWGSVIFYTSAIGAYLSKDEIYRNDIKAFYEYYPPQIQNPLDRFLADSVNWMLVSGSFIAEGGEKYITIGNFLPDTLTPAVQFKENNTSGVGISASIIGFIGIHDCTGHNYTCNAGGNQKICAGESVVLGTDSDNRRQYRWSPAIGLSDSTAARSIASPTETTTYYLYVIDEFLQQSYDTITVEVVYCDVFIPNIFSPNGDGQNDVLYVRGRDIEQLTFTVYNRWGEVVFQTTDPAAGWDGTYKGRRTEPGVYVYHVSAVLQDGLVVSKYGDVTVVR